MKLFIIILICSLFIIFIKNKYFIYKNFNYTFPIKNNTKRNNETYNIFYSKIYDDIFYDKKRYDYETNIILNLIKILNEDSVNWLDIACGTSKHFQRYNKTKQTNVKSKEIQINYVGIDKSIHMLNIARKNIKNKHKHFSEYDYHNLKELKQEKQFKKKFNVISSFYCGLCYTINIETIFTEISKLLNGYFVFSYLDKDKLENLELTNQYLDKKIHYKGIWQNYKNKTYYHEYFYENNTIVYYNKHTLYILHNIRDILKKYFLIIKEINYKQLFDANDEILFILKKKSNS